MVHHGLLRAVSDTCRAVPPLAVRWQVWASDGVWEFMSSQEVVDIVALIHAVKGSNPREACEAVVKEATKRWKVGRGPGGGG